MKGPLPVGEAVRVLDCPAEIEDGAAFGVETDGGAQVTVTIAVRLSAVGAHWPVTRTQ